MGMGVGVPSLAFLDTVENVFDSTEVKIVTTMISYIYEMEYQGNEPSPQTEREEPSQCNYMLRISRAFISDIQ